MRMPDRFEKALKSYLTASKLGLLHKEDREPTCLSFGLSDWEGNAIKLKVKKEVEASKDK